MTTGGARWRVRRALLLLLLAAPVASAAGFEGSMSDRPDDVVTRDFRPYHAPTTDILSFSSRVLEGTTVEQRVEMAAPPSLATNSIIVRSWFRHSTNGSFYTLDLEVHSEAEPDVDRFVAYTRRDAFTNATQVEAQWRLEEATWVFTFDAAEVAPDAECFLPMVYAYLSGPHGSGAFDSIGMTGRPCETAPEPGNAPPGARTPRFPATASAADAAASSPPAGPAPGSRTPPPTLALGVFVLAGLAGAVWLARNQRR